MRLICLEIAVLRHLEWFFEESRPPLKLKNNRGLLSDIFFLGCFIQKIWGQRSKSLSPSFIYNIVQYPEYSKISPQISIVKNKSNIFLCTNTTVNLGLKEPLEISIRGSGFEESLWLNYVNRICYQQEHQ